MPALAGSPSEIEHADQIDTHTVLDIGGTSVSGYLVWKFYNRFAEDIASRLHRDPSQTEKAAWLMQFLSKEVVIAHAKKLGYFDRPEVRELVRRMEVNMLTQAGGPYYQLLYHRAAPTEIEIKKLYERSFTSVVGEILQYRDPETFSNLLGRDFDDQSPGIQTSRILRSRDSVGVSIQAGSLLWPFDPFSDICESMESVPIGRWTKITQENGYVYLAYVRERQEIPHNDLSLNRRQFDALIKTLREREIILKRRREILLSAGVLVDSNVAVEILRFLESLPHRVLEIPGLPADLRVKELFTYRFGLQRKSITVGAYRDYIDDLFVKRIPSNMEELRWDVENLVIRERDLLDARAARVDQSAKFIEDRRGFAAYQALDLFEKEVIAPEIKIDAKAVEDYYLAHNSDYRITNEIAGRLLRFRNASQASAWLRSTNVDCSNKLRAAVVSDTMLRLKRDEVMPELESLKSMLLGIPEGGKLGPLMLDRGSYAIFVKVKDLSQAPIPLEIAAKSIREILLRQEIDTKERALAGQWSTQLEIVDHLDYARLGLTATNFTPPWRS